MGAFGAGLTLSVLAVPLFSLLSPAPASAQDIEYILFYARARDARDVEYCGVTRADVRYPGKKIDQTKSRRTLCKKLVTRLRMGVQYPDAAGSCPGYDVNTARQCMQDGVNLGLLVRSR